MSADLDPSSSQPRQLDPAAAGGDDKDNDGRARTGTRTPRPYRHGGWDIQQDLVPGASRWRDGGKGRWKDTARSSGRTSPTAGSESGTEADDERRSFARALPPPNIRPRKGLKIGETSEEAFLTPSQLDDEGRRLSGSGDFYFSKQRQDTSVSAEGEEGEEDVEEEEEEEERRKLLRRRLAEFARRSSEAGLMAVMILSVLCGQGVLRAATQWRRELAAHVAIMATLVLAYPIKLSIVDTRARKTKLWERFRVPASFDPATVLYPPFIPILVALSVSATNPATILPNIILGLSSLPQRLFPRSSRLGGINAVHWLVSILPLIAAENTAWPSSDWPPKPYMLKCSPPDGLPPETLVSLYPLHSALMQPLQYLTTTSLLISELHLLSAALINLLLLASSPQAIILKACLWIGGVSLFVLCSAVLRWNVTLARVPKWKLRRPGHTAEERRSLVDAVSELINLQRASAAFKASSKAGDSDADEDEPNASIKRRFSEELSRRPDLSASARGARHRREPKSAVLPRVIDGLADHSRGMEVTRRQRSTAAPSSETPEPVTRQTGKQRSRTRSSNLSWYLHLTPEQAVHRKWVYAAYVYLAIALIVLVPVRRYIGTMALKGTEPFGWALGYLLGHWEAFSSLVGALGLDDWVPLPSPAGSWREILLTTPLNAPALRQSIGPAHVRILLIGYWAVVLVTGLLAVFTLTEYVEVDTRRKVFHGVMVAMLLPATFVDPCYCALALALALALFLLLEVIRAGQIPPLGSAIGRFVAPYVDGRDLRGPVVVSHIFLLVGCAVPLWFSLASIGRDGSSFWAGWEPEGEGREVAMIAGVVCVGMGDAAASLIGRRYGRHKWIWVGGKSLEGSAAFAAAVTVGLLAAKCWLLLGGWRDVSDPGSTRHHVGGGGVARLLAAWLGSAVKAGFCACAASFTEAVLTGANDNVVVPIALWLFVRGVRL